MPTPVSAVDAYIARAQPFAHPILTHLRTTVHRAAPDVEEQIKWSRPFFVLGGVILGNMAAFKEHCSFGLWGSEMAGTLRAQGIDSSEGMGTFGEVRSLADLPPDLEDLIRQAAGLIRSGARTQSIQRVAKPTRRDAPPVPTALADALRENPAAEKHFAGLSPSCRREYIEWIEGAKRDETRARRIATALENLAAGKNLNWRYASTPRASTPA